MAIPGKTLKIVRGVTKTIELTVRDEDGALVNLTGATVHLRMKLDINDDDPAFAKSSAEPAEASVLDQDLFKGKARFFLVPADTADIDPSPMQANPYVYDSWVVLVGDARHAVIVPSQLARPHQRPKETRGRRREVLVAMAIADRHRARGPGRWHVRSQP
jgi:hypothetical protein